MQKFRYYFTIGGLTLVIIGVHQSTIRGFGESYWIFMLSASLLLYSVVLDKTRKKPQPPVASPTPPKPNKPIKKKKKG